MINVKNIIAKAARLDGSSRLHRAIDRGDTYDAVMLVLEGKGLDEVDEDDFTPLHKAAGLGQESVVKALLEKGADPNIKGPAGLTALHIAAISNEAQPSIISSLLKAGSNALTLDDAGCTAIGYAATAALRRGMLPQEQNEYVVKIEKAAMHVRGNNKGIADEEKSSTPLTAGKITLKNILANSPLLRNGGIET